MSRFDPRSADGPPPRCRSLPQPGVTSPAGDSRWKVLKNAPYFQPSL